MAEASPEEVDELFDCPVCLEKYREPRILACGHQFCLECLEQIFMNDPTRGDQAACPTCRQKINLKPGKVLKDLPRPVLLNQLQNLLMGPSKMKSKKACQLCEKDSSVTSYCYQCKKKICESCESDHGKTDHFEGHLTVAISEIMLCDIHEDSIVIAFCYACLVGICVKCAATEHKGHKNEDINEMARQHQEKLKEVFTTLRPSGELRDKLAAVKSKVQEIERSQNDTVGLIDRSIDSLKTLELKLKLSRSEVLTKTSADIEALKFHEADLGKQIASRAKLLDYGIYLTEEASSYELVLQAREFIAASTSESFGQLPTINKPPEHKLGQVESQLSKLVGLSDIKFQSEILQIGKAVQYQRPIQDLKFLRDVQLVAKPKSTFKTFKKFMRRKIDSDSDDSDEFPYSWVDIRDVAFIPNSSLLAVRCDDEEAPIKLYNLRGALVKTLGKNVRYLDDGQLSFDPKRGLLLATCEDHLTTMDINRGVCDVIQVEECELSGVAYCATTDEYIVTDVANKRILTIDAKTRKVVHSFGSDESGDFFEKPFHVCVADIQGRITIVVSDKRSDAVKLFDLAGHHVKTYGSEGEDEGQLDSPGGVAVDPAGHVIVCDTDNNRVMSYWSERGKDHWQCLLSGEQLVEEPKTIDIDPLHKLVAITNDHNIKLYSYQSSEVPSFMSNNLFQTIRDK